MGTFEKHLAVVKSGNVTKSNVIGIRKAFNEFSMRSYSRSTTAPQWTLEQVNAMEHALERYKPRVTGELHETGLTLLRSKRYAKRLAPVANIIAEICYFELIRFDPINPDARTCKWVPVYGAVSRGGRSFAFRNIPWQSAFYYGLESGPTIEPEQS